MHQVELDVEHLKAQMDAMTKTQNDIRDSIKDIANAISGILELRKAHDYHEAELTRLRESSHKQANHIQRLSYCNEQIEKLSKRIAEVEKIEVNMRIKIATHSAVIGLVNALITAGLIFGLKGLGH